MKRGGAVGDCPVSRSTSLAVLTPGSVAVIALTKSPTVRVVADWSRRSAPAVAVALCVALSLPPLALCVGGNWGGGDSGGDKGGGGDGGDGGSESSVTNST